MDALTESYADTGDGWVPTWPQPTNWAKEIAAGVPEVEYLVEPYVPAGARIWIVGAAGTMKSWWALATSARLSREGRRVVYISEENPRAVELRRLSRIDADPERQVLYLGEGFDLKRDDHVRRLHEVTDSAALVVLDTLTAVWSGDESSNAEIAGFDRTVLAPLVARGTSILVVHHTGHPGLFGPRRGVSAPRGASAIGQKADELLVFESAAGGGTMIRHAKSRVIGDLEPVRSFELVEAAGRLTVALSAVRAGMTLEAALRAHLEAGGDRRWVACRDAVRAAGVRASDVAIGTTRKALLEESPEP